MPSFSTAAIPSAKSDTDDHAGSAIHAPDLSIKPYRPSFAAKATLPSNSFAAEKAGSMTISPDVFLYPHRLFSRKGISLPAVAVETARE